MLSPDDKNFLDLIYFLTFLTMVLFSLFLWSCDHGHLLGVKGATFQCPRPLSQQTIVRESGCHVFDVSWHWLLQHCDEWRRFTKRESSFRAWGEPDPHSLGPSRSFLGPEGERQINQHHVHCVSFMLFVGTEKYCLPRMLVVVVSRAAAQRDQRKYIPQIIRRGNSKKIRVHLKGPQH